MSVHKNPAPEYYFEHQLVCMYEILRRSACRMTSANEHKCREIFASREVLLDRWADHEMKMLGESKNLRAEKAKVLTAFTNLFQKRIAVFEKQAEAPNPKLCSICGNELTLAYWGEEMVCEKCAQPIIDALDQLVNATTDRYTAEDVFKIWQQWTAAFAKI